jgi:predicted  nucleic acid-binding Zn-ribbon protein
LKEKLAALIALQQLDSGLAALQRQYAALDHGAKERTALESARTAHDEAEATLHATTTELRDSELEQKAVEAKAADFEKKLYGGSVRAAKELQAMQEEIEMLQRQRAKLDEKILQLMDDKEARTTREAATRETLKQAQAAFNAKQTAYKRDASKLTGEARELTAQRRQAAAEIEAALLKQYENLRAIKNGLAVVAIEEGKSCGGCKLTLPASLVTRAHLLQSVELCDNCGRILVP